MTAAPFTIGSDTWPGISKAVEEVGELLQVLGKLMATGGQAQHYDGSDLHQRLQDELGDVYGALAFLQDANPVVDREAVRQRAQDKLCLFWRWQYEQQP